jgi:endonuclease/exonuclease/phosphatase (EEP) superfamily protein YafD
VLGFVLAVGLAAYRSPLAALALPLALWHGWVWWDVPGAARAAACATQPLSVVSFNLAWSNPRPDEAVEALRRLAPDLLAVSENTREWAPKLERLRADLPNRSSAPAELAANPTLYSRFPIVEAETLWPFAEEATSKSVVLRRAAVTYSYDVAHVLLDDGRRLAIVAIHAPGPESRRARELRDRYLAHLAATVAKLAGPVIVLGDFNTTPWSPAYRDLTAAAGLTSASGGHIATWPVWFAPLRVPIDHVLVRGPVTVLEAERGPDIGSDHFPVLATLCIGG